MRWAKGHLQALVGTGPKLLKHIFITKGAANLGCKDAPWYKKLFNNIRLRFMSLDMLSVVYPRSLVTLFKRIVVYFLKLAAILLGADFTFSIFKTSLESGIAALTATAFYVSLVTYGKNIITAAYIYIIEHKRIEHIPFFKKVWFCLTFPLFDIIGKFSLLVALFKKVEWKAIPHTVGVKIEDIKTNTKV